jgi:YD repeat-containing protein
MKTLQVAIRACSIALLAAVRLGAQIAPGGNADAIHPAGAPDPQKLDAVWHVDPISDQVTINIPFTTTPEGGRGPKLPFALLYNSGSTVTLQVANSFVIAVPNYNGQSTIYDWSTKPISGSSTAPSGPWTTTGPYIYYSSSTYPPGQNYSGCTIDGPYIYVDENGSAHDMNLISLPDTSPGTILTGSPCASAQYFTPPDSTNFWPSSSTTDGSAIESLAVNENVSPYVFYEAIGPDGTSATGSFESSTGPVMPATTTLTDPNGNSATLSLSNHIYTATDALGRTVFTTNIPIGITGQIPAGPYTLTTYGESGATETYNITFATKQISSFNMPHPTSADIGVGASVNPPGTSPNNTFTAVTKIELPDSTSYQFTYDPTYGTISQITFPTGGYARFCWGIRNEDWEPEGQASIVSSIVVTDAFTATGTEPAGSCGTTPPSDESHWSYALESRSSTVTTPIGQVTAPDGSVTKYTGTCFDYSAITVFGAVESCKESSRAIYDSSGNLKMSVAQGFDLTQGVPLQVATTLYDGPSPLQQLVNYVRDAYTNVIEKDESNYYTCTVNSTNLCSSPAQGTNATTAPSGGWIRSTFTTYNSSLVATHIVNKPAQVAITNGVGSNGGGTIPASVTPNSLTKYTYDSHGNLTGETKCTSISGTTCLSSWNTSYYYDSTGQLTCKVDGPGLGSNQVGSCPAAGLATTYYTWGGQANGYLHTVTNPNGATDSYTYFESTTGQVETHKDWNQNPTTYDYPDPLNRIRTITAPPTLDGTTGTSGRGLTTYTYTDSPGEFAVQEQHLITGTTQTSTTRSYDGLGRLETFSTVDPTSQCSSGAILVQTTYDSMSRIHTVSNPYCTTSDPTYGLTTYAYDALGRKTQITNADGSQNTIGYGGNATEFTDPSNGSGTPQHIQQVNGLGQLTNLCEVTTANFGPGAPALCNLNVSGTGYRTDYTYDPLNNLLSASQHGISRSFNYDSLSRLTYALNPETSAVTYSYLTSGSAPCAPDPTIPCSKADARGVTISYGYDNLSRLRSKTYSYSGNNSSTPISCYQYDAGSGTNPTGHLTNAWTQPASSGSCNSSPTSFINLKSFVNYDAAGRLLNATQQTCINGTCTGPSAYQVSMTYDLLGDTTALTNSVGANNQSLTLTNSFDVASHPCLTTSNWTTNASPNIFQVNPSASSTSPGYSPAGGLQNYYLGSTASSALTTCTGSPASPINVVVGYSPRFWVNSISATGQIP